MRSIYRLEYNTSNGVLVGYGKTIEAAKSDLIASFCVSGCEDNKVFYEANLFIKGDKENYAKVLIGHRDVKKAKEIYYKSILYNKPFEI